MVVGQPTVTKPSRSDEVPDPDQQLQSTNQIRAHFESLTPKRPTKPNRSESDSISPPPSFIPEADENFHAPELDKLKSLHSQSKAILTETSTAVQEEFVETQYYNELYSIDQQHHTTGSGFIKVGSEIAGNDYGLQLGGHDGDYKGEIKEMVCRSNPATNDWIPRVDEQKVEYVSSKPNRSESC